VKAGDGTWIEADEKIDGGPSVVFDAVAVLTDQAGAAKLAKHPAARDFITDAFVHLKFIAYAPAAKGLLEGQGVDTAEGAGVIALAKKQDAGRFVEACRDLRCWARNP